MPFHQIPLSRHEVVFNMRRGVSPSDAIKLALTRIRTYYPDFNGAMVAVTTKGEIGSGYMGFAGFQYTAYDPVTGTSSVFDSNKV